MKPTIYYLVVLIAFFAATGCNNEKEEEFSLESCNYILSDVELNDNGVVTYASFRIDVQTRIIID